MNYIELIRDFDTGPIADLGTDKVVNELFNGSFRRIVEVRLQNNAVLAKHKADVPITVFCISGAGIFLAGPHLEDSQLMRPGTLITLEAGVEHEVVADPAIDIIVTRFKPS